MYESLYFLAVSRTSLYSVRLCRAVQALRHRGAATRIDHLISGLQSLSLFWPSDHLGSLIWIHNLYTSKCMDAGFPASNWIASLHGDGQIESPMQKSIKSNKQCKHNRLVFNFCHFFNFNDKCVPRAPSQRSLVLHGCKLWALCPICLDSANSKAFWTQCSETSCVSKEAPLYGRTFQNLLHLWVFVLDTWRASTYCTTCCASAHALIKFHCLVWFILHAGLEPCQTLAGMRILVRIGCVSWW